MRLKATTMTNAVLARVAAVLVLPSLIPAIMAQNNPGPAHDSGSKNTRARADGAQETSSIFAAAPSYAAGIAGATGAVVADFNGDGVPDMAVWIPCTSDCNQTEGRGSLAVLLGNGDGTFQTPVAHAGETFGPVSLAVGDFNGDGKLDLALACGGAGDAGCERGAVRVLLGNGDGSFQASHMYAAGAGSNYSLAAGDFDGDGKLDLVVAYQTGENSAVAVLVGNGDGSFQAPVSYSTGAPCAVFVAVGDFNNDGAPDLAVVNGCVSDTVSVLLGNGDGTLQTAVIYPSGGAFAASLAVGDFNGDGAADLAVVNNCANYDNLVCASSGSVGVLLGNGDGTFNAPVSYASGASQANFVTVGDFNGDGHSDLAVGFNAANGSDRVVSLLLGNGDGTFQAPARYGPGGPATMIATGDFNRDGQPDVVFSNVCPAPGSCADGGVSVLVNTAANFNLYANSTALSASANPAGLGQATVLKATVTPSVHTGTVTGNVIFYDGGNPLSTAAVADRQAALTTSFLTPGAHAIKASYSGAASYAPSTSTVERVTVGTPVRLNSSPNPSTKDQPATITANVGGASGTPTGSVTFMDGAAMLGAVTLAGGRAALGTSSLSTGTHSITASYGGDANFQPGAAMLAHAVSQPTRTVLASSLNPAKAGQPVTFTAKVTGQSSGVPTGTVAFQQGGTTFGTASLVKGQASITMAFTNANGGTKPITAVYLGSPAYQASTSAAIKQAAKKDDSISTTTTIQSSGSPSLAGQPVTFTATVSPSDGTTVPDGEAVTFYDGLNAIGTGATASGVAIFTTSSLAQGNHPMTATYAGDSTYQSSTSATLTQIVNLTTTSTTLTSSANPSAWGESVTFTATVKPGSGTGTPTGNVTFRNGTTIVSSATLASGVATYVTSNLTPGSSSISATYGGDANFSGSSATSTQVVSQATTTTALTSSPNPSTVNQSVTFTATVSGQYGGAVTGTVAFMQGTTTLGSASPVNGKAAFSTAFSAIGTYQIDAVYSGDTNDLGSTSATVGQVVALASTTTTVTSSGTPSFVGQAVTFTATVTTTSGTIPNGELVTFYDGQSALGTGKTATGVATYATSSLGVGTHSVTATYAGDATNQSSTSHAITQVVKVNTTNTALSSSVNPSTYGQVVTFTASVTATSGSGTPTGQVVFKNGTTAVAQVALSNGTAAYSTSTLAVGPASMSAAYTGDANFASSSATLSQVVGQATTSTTLTSSPNPSTLSQTITFTATVTAQYSGTLTGTVAFMQGAKTLGTASPVKGKATFATTFSATGTYPITAVYSGDANNVGSTSGVCNQVVGTNTTTTTLTSSVSPSSVDQAVTFTAAVTSTSGSIPDGETVTFYDGSTAIGTGKTESGAAQLTTSSLTAGAHTMTATYAGDASFEASTSKALTQVVNKNTTTTVVVSSGNPSVYGQPVTFTATVTSAGPTPTGTVTFKNGGTTLGTASLGSKASTTLTSTTLGAGNYTITASYNGDTASATSTSTGMSQVVSQATTTTVLVASVNPSSLGESVTFTAIVMSVTTVPTGTVTFTGNGTVLGTATLVNGSAKLAVTTLLHGSTTVTATYGASANVAGSTASLVQVVN
ncbi:MAG: Ig-like domain repeat protein [Bryobacteraceae bacterium]